MITLTCIRTLVYTLYSFFSWIFFLFFFFKTYKQLYIIHVYNFMSLEVNIHQLKLSSQSMTQTYPSLPKISSHPLIYYYYYYLVIRTLNIISILRKTQSIQYSTANYWHYCQCISRTFSSCIAKTSYPLINISLFFLPSSSWQPLFYPLLL